MSDAETVAANKALLTDAFDGLAKADPAVFLGAMDENLIWDVKGSSQWSNRIEGLANVERDLVGPLFSRFDGPYRNFPDLILADGDHVVVQARGEAKTVDGNDYNNDYCFIFRLSGGKIVEVQEYMDTKLADEALGPHPAKAGA